MKSGFYLGVKGSQVNRSLASPMYATTSTTKGGKPTQERIVTIKRNKNKNSGLPGNNTKNLFSKK